jgi:hypothetical protein
MKKVLNIFLIFSLENLLCDEIAKKVEYKASSTILSNYLDEKYYNHFKEEDIATKKLIEMITIKSYQELVDRIDKNENLNSYIVVLKSLELLDAYKYAQKNKKVSNEVRVALKNIFLKSIQDKEELDHREIEKTLDTGKLHDLDLIKETINELY